MNKKLFIFLFVGFVSFSLTSNIFAITWTPPTAQFPAENTQPPIDISSQDQTKSAGIKGNFFDTSVRSGYGQQYDAFIMRPNGVIKSGQNSFNLSEDARLNGAKFEIFGKTIFSSVGDILLSSSGGNFILSGGNGIFTSRGAFTFTAPGTANFSTTHGLTLPNYSTTVLGDNVSEGTLTYNNGQVYVFTGRGGIGGGEANLNNDALRKQLGLTVEQAKAQGVGNGWVPLLGSGGSYSSSTTIISGSNFWKRNGSVLYNDPATSTAVAIGNDGSVYPSAGNMLLTIGKAVGTTEPINIHIGGDQVIADNAYWNGTSWNFNTGGDSSGATAIMMGNGSLRFAVATDNRGPLTWVEGLKLTNGGDVEIKQRLSFSSGGSGGYGIKNDYGTLNFVNNLSARTFEIGQDGAATFTKDLRSYSGKLAFLGAKNDVRTEAYSSLASFGPGTVNSSIVQQVQNVYGSINRCSCDINTTTLECSNATPTEPVNTICYDRFEARPLPSLIPQKNLFTRYFSRFVKKAEAVEDPLQYATVFKVISANSAELQLGGGVGSNSYRQGVLKLMQSGSNSGEVTISNSGGMLSISSGDENSSQKMNIKLSNLVNGSGVSQCGPTEFLTLNSNKELICSNALTSVPPLTWVNEETSYGHQVGNPNGAWVRGECPVGYYVVGLEMAKNAAGPYCIDCFNAMKMKCAKVGQ